MTETTNEAVKSADINKQEPDMPRYAYSINEKLLIAAALAFAVLFDRLIWNGFIDSFYRLPLFSGIFMLTVIVFLAVVSRNTLFKNPFLATAYAILALLCIWNFFYDYDSDFGWLNMFVIPSAVMTLIVVLFGGFRLKECGRIVAGWFSGFWVKPFSAIHRFFGALLGSLSGSNRRLVIKCLVGLVISAVVLSMIIPLLMSADMVFGYYLNETAKNFNIGSIVLHTIVIIIATLLFYSFMWNMGYGKSAKRSNVSQTVAIGDNGETVGLDAFITSFVLIAILLVYTLFCVIQFGYLFAGAGLPGHLTYSEYAREGFAQLVAVAAINLGIFGIVTRYCDSGRLLTFLRIALLAFTMVMTVSAFLRLWLYIEAYGLTWLRLISAWFMCYLSGVTVLCGVRIVRKKLPVMAVAALILCGWFCVLGYANPDALIERYNNSQHPVASDLRISGY